MTPNSRFTNNSRSQAAAAKMATLKPAKAGTTPPHRFSAVVTQYNSRFGSDAFKQKHGGVTLFNVTNAAIELLGAAPGPGASTPSTSAAVPVNARQQVASLQSQLAEIENDIKGLGPEAAAALAKLKAMPEAALVTSAVPLSGIDRYTASVKAQIARTPASTTADAPKLSGRERYTAEVARQIARK